LQSDNAPAGAAGDSASAVRAEVAEVKARLADSQKAAEQHGATVAELTGYQRKTRVELKDLQVQLATLPHGEHPPGPRVRRRDEAAEQRAAKSHGGGGPTHPATTRLAAARAGNGAL